MALSCWSPCLWMMTASKIGWNHGSYIPPVLILIVSMIDSAQGAWIDDDESQ